MRRGRKPKPAALKVLTGNPGKRPLSPEPDYPKGWPEMPDWLDERGREEWDRVTAQLKKSGVVRLIDGTLLAGYCDAVSRAITASEKARIFAVAVGQADRTWTVVRQFAALFGIGPAERGRVAGAESPKAKRSLLA